MILLFYDLALMAALVLGLPWWLWKMATTRKYRGGLRERLGRVPARLGLAQPVVWVHAVSVGEVLAVSRLVTELAATLPAHQVMISTTTRTGQELARSRFGQDRVFYCPLDLPWAVNAYLDTIQPKMLVLAETEFWPNLLTGCRRRGIPVAVVNARISDRSFPRYWRTAFFWKGLLAGVDLALTQSAVDAERLKAIGCRDEAVRVAGNLKFDVRAAGESEAVRALKRMGEGLRLIVAGSTLEGEEAALLELWPELTARDPRLAMVLAPRHPERFEAVAGLLGRSGLKWQRRSEWPEGGPAEALKPGEIVLLDTIGELASVYAVAAVAFVGGSVVPAGGHNPLEPAQFGVPIVMGPHTHNFRAITEDLRTHEAVKIASREELRSAFFFLLENTDETRAMGERARRVFEGQAGATGRTVEALKGLLAAKGAAQ
jgi:3-deoxy-D-manno-octulosonic-acid transferase